MKHYTCPVCGYNEMDEEPARFTICVCCRTMFEYSDASWTHEQLREDWIAAGMPWGDKLAPPPNGWNPVAQLRNIGYEVTKHDLDMIARAHAKPPSLHKSA